MIRLFLNVCKTFQKIKHLDFNDYDLYLHLSSVFSADSFSCPSCRAPKELFVCNGTYERHLVFIDNGHVQDRIIRIRNLHCSSCKKSHAILYSLIIPHCSYGIRFTIELIYSRLTGRFKNIPLLCAFFDISERTFYRIWKRLMTDAHRINVILDSFCDILKSVRILFHSDSLFFHYALESFFKSCGYSFMQPHITFRQHIFIPDGSINPIR